eukprot:CAMPEP_0185829934 /NCGR_PEP_ID=MMETSP1353-20130828/533_1 /TAXON_ID=1077150 /ORGANISM="Erythrolobus australicus, Strain CCMP3124" /LENGTH=41 /DNA_ID= /DNA_START= /DNA_END= /DNA_ORIENTATION=
MKAKLEARSSPLHSLGHTPASEERPPSPRLFVSARKAKAPL